MTLKYICLVLISLIADILNYFLAPIVVLFASQEGWLPRWFSWFQTPDNSLDGDNGWQLENRPFKVEDSSFKKYINRVAWLYRNSVYGFAISVLGIKILPTDRILTVGNPKVSNRPLVEGLVKRYLYRDSKVIAFQWYYVISWSPTRCVRLNFGWKLWGNTPTGQLVFSPSVTMGYSLKKD